MSNAVRRSSVWLLTGTFTSVTKAPRGENKKALKISDTELGLHGTQKMILDVEQSLTNVGVSPNLRGAVSSKDIFLDEMGPTGGG